MAGFTGIAIQFVDPQPTTPTRQAGFTGVSFMIEPKVLVVKVLRIDNVTRQLLPVRDVQFRVALSGGAQTEYITTNALGVASIDFPDPYIEVFPNEGTIPGGYQYSVISRIETLARNFITVVLVPIALERYYTEWEVL